MGATVSTVRRTQPLIRSEAKNLYSAPRMAKSVRTKWVYVLVREMYHTAEGHESDMVAATPIKVHAGTDTGRISLKTEAKKLAQEQCSKFGGEVKEHGYGGKYSDEYRVWLDSPHPNADRFVYVVRQVEYSNG